MNKRAWAMTAPLVVLVALLVASCGDDSPTPTGSSSRTPPTLNVVPSLTLVGSGLTSDGVPLTVEGGGSGESPC